MEKKLDSLELDFRVGDELTYKARLIDDQIKKLESEKKELSNKTIEECKKIRLAKVKELHDKLKSYRLEIKKILEQRESIVRQYCKKNGHNYVRICTKTSDSPKYRSFKDGNMYDAKVTYKCTTCGYEHSVQTIDRPRLFEGDNYKCVIPDECLNSKHSRCGKTFIELTSELKELLIKEKYALLALSEMCNMFGHDAIVVNPERDAFDQERIYKCKCCEKTMYAFEYDKNYVTTLYPGLVDYKGIHQKLIVPVPSTLDLSNVIDIRNLEASVVVPGIKVQEEEKEKQLKLERKSPKLYDCTENKHKIYTPKK